MLTTRKEDLTSQAYKLQQDLGLGGLWKESEKAYNLICDFQDNIIAKFQDKLFDANAKLSNTQETIHRRNLQIADLKKKLKCIDWDAENNYTSNLAKLKFHYENKIKALEEKLERSEDIYGNQQKFNR